MTTRETNAGTCPGCALPWMLGNIVGNRFEWVGFGCRACRSEVCTRVALRGDVYPSPALFRLAGTPLHERASA